MHCKLVIHRNIILQQPVMQTTKYDIRGVDDHGNFYQSLSELHNFQEENKESFYLANELWWDSGYGGRNDDEAMIGDCDGESDANDGLCFLEQVLSLRSNMKTSTALDCGAGVGRIAKFVLLRKCTGIVSLLEANKHWSLRSRAYLGRKRSSRCNFVNSRMENIGTLFPPKSFNIIWFQWCLQYLTDLDVIRILRASIGLLDKNSIIIVKENKPTSGTTGSSRQDRFQMDTPTGAEGRYDITRPLMHHLYLFEQAGLQVIFKVDGVETLTFALEPCPQLHNHG